MLTLKQHLKQHGSRVRSTEHVKRITITGPMRFSMQTVRKLIDEGYRVLQSGGDCSIYRKDKSKEMDARYFLIIAEKKTVKTVTE